jgi:hypothetical protein
VTPGDDFRAVLALASKGSGGAPYPAREVVDNLRTGLARMWTGRGMRGSPNLRRPGHFDSHHDRPDTY